MRRHLSYANVTATVALFVALGGSSYAAVQLSKNSVGAAQIRAGAVRSSEVKNGALATRDLSAAARRALRGNTGATGPQGPKGDKGDPGPATGPASGVLSGSYPGPVFAAGVDEVIPVAIAATNTDGSLRNEAHRAPATGPVATSNGGTGITDFSVPGVTFQSSQDVAVCTAGEEDITVDVESIGGNTLRVFTSNLAGAATNSQLYCAIFDNS